MNPTTDEFYASLYDAATPDWPGEIDFYQALATDARQNGQAVLEVACGTGRITIRLARGGGRVVGLDLLAAMLDVAREKSAGMDDLRWVQGDMRSFDLGEFFALAIIPGHSFQFILTPEDQLECLRSIHRHLIPGGTLVLHLDHQDFSWLGGLCSDKGGVFEKAEQVIHPVTGRNVQAFRAWSYAPATQTATALTRWEENDADGRVVNRWERGPIQLHCAFRFEVEHLLVRAGFELSALYGDFFANELRDESTEMVWVARR